MNSFDRYMNEIGGGDLLDADGEVRLAQAIEQGRQAAATLESRSKLSQAGRRALQRQVNVADRARNEFVSKNLRLVVAVARNYARSTLDLDDLVQEGNIGLMRAVDGFDWSLGYRFSTYATWWVRQSILRALASKGRTVRIPAHQRTQVRALAHANETLAGQLCRMPTRAEVADYMDVTVDRVEELEAMSANIASLSVPVGDGDTELVDLLPDATEESPEDAAFASETRSQLESLVALLPERAALVVRLRFGLDTEEPMTLEQVAQRLGITRERARQIEQRALSQLRRDAHQLVAA